MVLKATRKSSLFPASCGFYKFFVCWVLFAYPQLLLDWIGELAFFDVDPRILLRFRFLGIWFRAEGRRNLAAQASLVGRGQWWIICKRPVHLDDHLQEAWLIQMIICKGPVYPNDHL